MMRIFNITIYKAFMVCTCLMVSALVEAEPLKLLPAKIDWAYQGKLGPDNWSNLDPSFTFCSQGKNQSPIDIPVSKPTALSKLRINYAPIKQINVQESNSQETEIISGHTLHLNVPPAVADDIIHYEETSYRLIQFHLHTPSEHTLAGKHYPAEIHLLHLSDEGQIAIISVWVILGPENPAIEQLIANMPKSAGKEIRLQKSQIEPMALLPSNQAHYQYEGSLTTPPCTEGVQWFVMANPITASAKQIAKLKHTAPAGSARPLQSLNMRQVVYAYVASK
jgi:carbonic anhydrase